MKAWHQVTLWALIGLLGAVVVAQVPTPTPTPTQERDLSAREEAGLDSGRMYCKLFYDGSLRPLHEKFSDEMREQMSYADFTSLRRQVKLQLGDETELLDESMLEKGDYVVYTRRARFDKSADVVEMRWVLRDRGVIAGVFVAPEESSRQGSTP